MLVVVLPREDAHSDAFLSGELLAPALIGWVVTWIVAHFWDGHWPWWVYALVVPAGVAALALLISIPSLADRAEGRTPDGGTRADAGPVLHELVAPASQGQWTKVDTPEVQQAEEQVRKNVGQYGEDVDSTVVGYYSHSAPEATVMYIGVNGTLEKGASLESTLRTALGGDVDHLDTFNPGSAKGVLGCGNLTVKGKTLVGCMWIGNQRAVATVWLSGGLDHQHAADLTAEFRDLAAGADQSPST
jgi:hypothetical protein